MEPLSQLTPQVTPENLARLVKYIPMAVWISDEKGETFWLNGHWQENYEEAKEKGSRSEGWLEGLHRDHEQQVRKAFQEAALVRQPFKCEYRVSGGSKDPCWVMNSATPSYDDEGNFVGYCGAVVDVTERNEARERAEIAERERSAVIRRLAHEIRNPLAPVRTGIDLLKRTDDIGVRQELLEIMETQLAEVSSLLNNLLDVTCVTEEQFSYAPALVSLRDLIEDMAKDRDHDFSVPPLMEDFQVVGDGGRLRQIVGSLLDNAVRFGSDSRPVVSLRRVEDRVLLEVADEGCGFTPEKASGLFEEFTSDEEGRTVGKGLGLSLSVARRLARMHGGDILASSLGEGRGATFTFEIPAADRAVVPPSDTAVLVIDDNPNILAAFEDYLVDVGHPTRVAGSAEMAFRVIEGFSPDVCLCDVGLPGADGFVLAERLKEIFPSIRLFSMSGYSDDETVRRSEEAGFLRHYVKPVSMEQFLGDL